MSMNFGTDLLPTTSGSYNLGSSSKKWVVYAAELKGIRTITNFSIGVNDWTGAGPFTYELTNIGGVTANSDISADLGESYSNLNASLKLIPAANKVTFSTEMKPANTISGTIEVTNIS